MTSVLHITEKVIDDYWSTQEDNFDVDKELSHNNINPLTNKYNGKARDKPLVQEFLYSLMTNYRILPCLEWQIVPLSY